MQNNSSPAAQGQYPAWHEHIEYIVGDNPRMVLGQARMRRMGMPVWSVLNNYFTYDGDADRVLDSYRGWITVDELNAALDFYKDYPDAIDRKLYEIAN